MTPVDDQIASTVRNVMSVFPTEEGIIVWLFVEHGGLNPKEVAQALPLGISQATAYRLYDHTDKIIRKMVEAEILPADLIHD